MIVKYNTGLECALSMNEVGVYSSLSQFILPEQNKMWHGRRIKYCPVRKRNDILEGRPFAWGDWRVCGHSACLL